jgi:hypothetical protein
LCGANSVRRHLARFRRCLLTIQLVTALGPGLYGLLHDLSGSYREPLLVAAAMDVIAAIVILRGRQKKTGLS